MMRPQRSACSVMQVHKGSLTLFTLRESPDASAVAMMVLDRKRSPLQRGTQGGQCIFNTTLIVMVSGPRQFWSRGDLQSLQLKAVYYCRVL